MRHLLSASHPLLFAFCALLFTSTAHADTLLVEVRMPGHHFDAGEILPTPMNFGAGAEHAPYFAGIYKSYTVADVGSVYEATDAEVASIAALLYEPDGSIGGYTMTEPWQWGISVHLVCLSRRQRD